MTTRALLAPGATSHGDGITVEAVEDRAGPVLDTLTRAGAFLCLAAGVTVMVAWYLHAGFLLRVHVGQAAIPFDAGLAVAVTGAALGAVSYGRNQAVPAAAGFDILLGVLELIEHGTGHRLGIDQLFVNGVLVGRTPLHPGRLAANTALCFVMVGVGLLVWGPGRFRPRPAALAASGSLVAAVATVALFGYAAGVPDNYGWGHPVGMSLPAAAALVLLAATLLTYALRDALQQRHSSPGWLAMPAGVLALGVGSAGWLAVTYRAVWTAQRANRRRIRAEAGAAAAELDIAAAELAQANGYLGRSNAELEQFAYFASHDLAEPLRAMSGPISLLARRYEGRLDEDADELIGFVVDGCQRMQGLIDGVLALSRVGRTENETVPVDLDAVVEGVLIALGPLIDERHATVTVDPLPVVLDESNQLSLVFQNLIANAVKFVPPGVDPVVSISVEHLGAQWCFSVTDNGIGIEPRHREWIFVMFKRLHARDEYPGTGIGLALVKKIIDRHGGRLGVESASSGTGCRFWFTLPATMDAAA